MAEPESDPPSPAGINNAREETSHEEGKLKPLSLAPLGSLGAHMTPCLTSQLL